MTRLVDLSMSVHNDMLTFPRVPPPTLLIYESWTEFAERIGAAEYGATSLTASYLVYPERPRRHAHRRGQAHPRPGAPGVGGHPARVLLLGRRRARLPDKEKGARIFPHEIDEALDADRLPLKERDIVLIHTGAGAYNTEERYMTDLPGMTAEATRHLIAQGVRMMGCDAITFDPPVWAMFEREALLGGAPRDERGGLLAPREPDESRPAALARLQARGLPDQVDRDDGRAGPGRRDPG